MLNVDNSNMKVSLAEVRVELEDSRITLRKSEEKLQRFVQV
jgi:hypothetical protein